MEPSRFDDLTKALATSTSRRHALKAIAATTLAGLLGLSGIETAFAKIPCLTKEEKDCCDFLYPHDAVAKCNCRLQSVQGFGPCAGGVTCADVDDECPSGPPTTFTCPCTDLTSQSTCVPADCSVELDFICTQLCASHLGYAFGSGTCRISC